MTEKEKEIVERMSLDSTGSIKEREDNLKELLEPTYPLLAKFKEACPGTFKHSQAVMTMIESVSLELGLDVIFMKVTAMYHDLGKINNPKYFTENQLDDENPHDNLDPYMSYQIISRHVSDTVNILLSYPEFPRELIEVIAQHHGNSVLKYFFDKSNGEDEDLFRYKCSKPTSTESAVLMICDHIEATSRSDYQHGKLDPTEVIESTISQLLDSGLLDNVTMKLGNFKKIKKALAKELEGTYQKRVAYVDNEVEVKEDE